MVNITESKIMTLDEAQDYLVNKHKILSEERVKKLYQMIENVNVRVNDNDKEWVAFCTDSSENQTVVEAITKIAKKNLNCVDSSEADIAKFVDEVGDWFVRRKITHKPRIPFYVLVLSMIIG